MSDITKILTHDFESKSNIKNFDTYMENFLMPWEYNTKARFKKQSVTNLEFIVQNSRQLYLKVVSLIGISLGNQSLNLISYEVVEVPDSETEIKHQNYKIQVYNDSDDDITTDVKVQLG